MDDADGGNGEYECAGTQESRKRDKLLQFTLLLKNGLVHAMRSTGPHQPSFSSVYGCDLQRDSSPVSGAASRLLE